MKNMKYKIKIDGEQLLKLEITSGLTPERITAKIQEMGIMYTYRQYKHTIKTGELPSTNGEKILEALENLFATSISVVGSNTKEAA